mmetsp:Transcript_8219/g.18444  ORF Transcript_8219/g.18444 Transcript_8219/m.18444 type:complete len:129 (+) Transcript_8219:2627-3013(+)
MPSMSCVVEGTARGGSSRLVSLGWNGLVDTSRSSSSSLRLSYMSRSKGVEWRRVLDDGDGDDACGKSSWRRGTRGMMACKESLGENVVVVNASTKNSDGMMENAIIDAGNNNVVNDGGEEYTMVDDNR